MTRRLLTGNAAAAWGARLAEAEYIPAFPITPQTEIIETLSGWIDGGEMNARMTMMESEHSMITAAGAAAVSGVRVFTATSSQGLLYAMEMLYSVSGWRAPFVLVNVSRGLGSPTTLEPDHNDIFAARDCGFLQIHCSTCQEVLDTVLLAYRIAEDSGVRLPVIVNLDGFYLSFTREPVDIPSPDDVRKFLPGFNPMKNDFHSAPGQSAGVVVMGGSCYSYFKYQAHLASLNGIEVFRRASGEFNECFGRLYSPVERYMMDDAEFCFIMTGSFATKAVSAVDRFRADGWKVGLIRPRLLRPFPAADMRESLAGIKAAAVIDQNLSPGMGGVLFNDTAASLYATGRPGPVLASYVAGLGGRDITDGDFHEMLRELKVYADAGTSPATRLIFTKDELEEIEKMQRIAGINLNNPQSPRTPGGGKD